MIVGGFYYSDCVKKIGKAALNIGINCLVDLELTDYFDINSYDPERFKEYMV